MWGLGEWGVGAEAVGGKPLFSGTQWPQKAGAEHLGSASERLTRRRGRRVSVRRAGGVPRLRTDWPSFVI